MSKLNSKLNAILCKSAELEGAVGYQWEWSQWRLCDSSPVDAVKLRNECYCDFTVQFVKNEAGKTISEIQFSQCLIHALMIIIHPVNW